MDMMTKAAAPADPVARRRTFAVISHPDAGKTTLTEKLLLFGYSWALIHHMLGGIRHLLWDTGRGLDLRTANMLSWLNIVGSIVLTALLWTVILGTRS